MQKNELENSKTKLNQSFEHSKTPTYRNIPAHVTNLRNVDNMSFASDTHNNLTNQVVDFQQTDRPLFDVCYNKERFRVFIKYTKLANNYLKFSKIFLNLVVVLQKRNI